jgi:hypothetical protein
MLKLFQAWRLSRHETERRKAIDRYIEQELSSEHALARQKLKKILARPPRIAVVKQDVQSDLYCCSRGSPPEEIVFSTLMRTGPVALFTAMSADFLVVETEPDPECGAWKQPATECRWMSLNSLELLRQSVPGRGYGQGEFAVSAAEIQWSDYDIVISIDVSVPARITRNYPSVAWCYYVREPKTSAYGLSQVVPVSGWDLFLNQRFRLKNEHAGLLPHEIEFPYYLQYPGCFNSLVLPAAENDSDRSGVFLEHHTVAALSTRELEQLERFGPVRTTAARSNASSNGFDSVQVKSKTSSHDVVAGLLRSKYFVQLGKVRTLWGNAAVEAISAGCLVLGDSTVHTHDFLFSANCDVRDFPSLLARIEDLERTPARFAAESRRQRLLVEYCCFYRPVIDLVAACEQVRSRKK